MGIDFAATFLGEAENLVGDLESVLLELEKDFSIPQVNRLFRTVHTLKGSSQAVGFSGFAKFVHKLEDLIEMIKEDNLGFIEDEVSLLFSSQLLIEKWIHALKDDRKATVAHKTQMTEISEFMKIRRPGPKVKKTKVVSDGLSLFDSDSPQKKSKKKTKIDSTKKKVGTKKAKKKKTTSKKAKKAKTTQTKKTKTLSVPIQNSGKTVHIKLSESQQDMVTGDSYKSPENIRVAANKIEDLVQKISEIQILTETMNCAMNHEGLSNPDILKSFKAVHSGIQSLYHSAFSMRMLAVGSMFQRLERAARDVARSQKKKIQVKQIGAETEIDKSILEKIVDPLIHVLRNAVDHGIEDQKERKKAKKPEIATIEIEAVHKNASTIIRVTDDGQGINQDLVLKKAKSNGLVPKNAKPSSDEINQMIFLPGFSTRDVVSEISGRGVGMDVVKTTIEGLGGDVNIESSPGQGSQLTMTIPTTNSHIDAFMFHEQGVNFFIPVLDVESVISLDGVDIDESDEQRSFYMNSTFVLLDHVEKMLPSQLKMKDRGHGSKKTKAFVVRSGTRLVAFDVEKMVKHKSVTISNFKKENSLFPGISGSATLKNGKAGLVLDIPYLTLSYLELKVSNEKTAS